MSWQGMPYFIFILLCALFSVSFLLMKKAVLGFSPAAVGFGRVLGGMLFLVVFFWLRGEPRKLRTSDTLPILIVAIFGFAWPFYIQPEIIPRVGSGHMAVIVSLVPLLTIAISAFWLGIMPTGRQFIGAVGAFVCLGILNWDRMQTDLRLDDLLLATTVPLGYAIANICVRQRLSHSSAMETTGTSLAVATIASAPMAFLSPSPTDVDAATFWWSLGSIAVLGVVHAGFSSWLFNKLIRDEGPLFAGMMTNVAPIGAVLIGIYDGEKFTMTQGFALAGIVAMVTLVQFGSAATREPLPSSDELHAARVEK
jgi:drug/metabolite transporter (DMT)-like permease